MNALDQQYIDRNEQRFAAVAHTEPGDLDIFDVIAQHLKYLDTAADDYAKSAQRGDGSIHMATAADVYAGCGAVRCGALRCVALQCGAVRACVRARM